MEYRKARAYLVKVDEIIIMNIGNGCAYLVKNNEITRKDIASEGVRIW